jgi:cytochrome P450
VVDTARLPLPSPRRFERRLALVDSVLYPLIAERRRSPGGEDLVSMLLEVADSETGDGLTDKQVRDETISFFIAGHATIASALTWTWYLLSTHPAVWRKLRAEVAEVLGDRPPAVADLPRLAYTGMVVQEAMRLYPPIYLVLRRAWPPTRSAATASRPGPTSPSART